MNTATIQALYSLYLPLQSLPTTDPLHRHVADLLATKIQRAAGQLTPTRYHVAIKDMAARSYVTATGQRVFNEVDLFCPQRVHAWALALQPATDRHRGLPDAQVWSAMTAAFPEGEAGEFMLRFGAKQDFALMLRGLRAYEHKQEKRRRKLLAQLRAYHQQQLSLRFIQPNLVPVAEAAVSVGPAAPVAAPSRGLLPRLAGRLRRGLAAKIHQAAAAAEALVLGDGMQAA